MMLRRLGNRHVRFFVVFIARHEFEGGQWKRHVKRFNGGELTPEMNGAMKC